MDPPQSFTIICSSCGKKFTRRLSPQVTCPGCGRKIDFARDTGSKRESTAQKKRPFDIGWKFLGTIVSHPTYGYAVATANPSGFLPCSVDGHVRIRDLLNSPRSFKVVARVDGRVVLRPIGRSPDRTRAEAIAVRIDPERLAPRILTLKIDREGESELERLVSKDPVRAFQRVTDLANEKNDPRAWWLLALGHRAQTLRKPIEQAIKQIGVVRFDRMVRQNPGTRDADWGTELLEFIDAEMQRLRRRRPGRYATLSADQTAWNRPWWAD